MRCGCSLTAERGLASHAVTRFTTSACTRSYHAVRSIAFCRGTKTAWLRLISVCTALASLLPAAGCEVPDAWKRGNDNPDASSQLVAGPMRNECGSGDASCDVPLGRYAIRYTGETGVRFHDESEDRESFPCEDHESLDDIRQRTLSRPRVHAHRPHQRSRAATHPRTRLDPPAERRWRTHRPRGPNSSERSRGAMLSTLFDDCYP